MPMIKENVFAAEEANVDGQMAYLSGIPLSNNPFRLDSRSWREWRRGWFEQQSDDAEYL